MRSGLNCFEIEQTDDCQLSDYGGIGRRIIVKSNGKHVGMSTPLLYEEESLWRNMYAMSAVMFMTLK